MARAAILNFQRTSSLYRGILDDIEGVPADVPADIAEDLDAIVALKALQEAVGGFSYKGGDCLDITTALAQIWNTVTPYVSSAPTSYEIW